MIVIYEVTEKYIKNLAPGLNRTIVPVHDCIEKPLSLSLSHFPSSVLFISIALYKV